MNQVDPNLLFKLATIKRQMAQGKRPTAPKSTPKTNTKPKKSFGGIPEFKSYNTDQLTNPTTVQGYAKGGEVLKRKPNHKTHPFRQTGQVMGGSGQDDVPALLTGGDGEKPGEFVMNQGAVLNLGLDKLNHENQRGLATLEAPTREPLNNTPEGGGVAQLRRGSGNPDQGWDEPFGLNQNVFDNPQGSPFMSNWGDYKQAMKHRFQGSGMGARSHYMNDRSGFEYSFNPYGSYGKNPPQGSPGYGQGPTQIPTFFDQQGYPFAVPVGGWGGAQTDSTLAPGAHIA